MRDQTPSLGWVGLAAIGLFYSNFLSNGLGAMIGDDARWIGLAQSLATGHGYRSIWSPGEPLHTYSPFLFPLILAPIIRFAGMNFWWMHLVVIGFAVGGAWATAKFLQGRLELPWASLGVWAAALSPCLIAHLPTIMAEFPMMAFSLLAILWIERYLKTERLWNFQGAMALLLILATVFTRPEGLALWLALGGLLCSQTTRLRRLQLLCLMGATALPIGWWFVRSFFFRETGYWTLSELLMKNQVDYSLGMVDLPAFLERLARNGFVLLKQWPYLLFSPPFGGILYQGTWILAADFLFWLGFLTARRRGLGITEWYLGASILILLAELPDFPFRHAYPLIPVLGYYLFLGLQTLSGWIFRQGRRGMIAALPAVCAVAWIGGNILFDAELLRLRYEGDLMTQAIYELQEAHQWIHLHASADAIVMSSAPSLSWLLSNRKAVRLPLTSVPEEALRDIRRVKANYLVVNPLLHPIQQRMIQSLVGLHQGAFRLAAQFGLTQIVEVRRND